MNSALHQLIAVLLAYKQYLSFLIICPPSNLHRRSRGHLGQYPQESKIGTSPKTASNRFDFSRMIAHLKTHINCHLHICIAHERLEMLARDAFAEPKMRKNALADSALPDPKLEFFWSGRSGKGKGKENRGNKGGRMKKKGHQKCAQDKFLDTPGSCVNLASSSK